MESVDIGPPIYSRGRASNSRSAYINEWLRENGKTTFGVVVVSFILLAEVLVLVTVPYQTRVEQQPLGVCVQSRPIGGKLRLSNCVTVKGRIIDIREFHGELPGLKGLHLDAYQWNNLVQLDQWVRSYLKEQDEQQQKISVSVEGEPIDSDHVTKNYNNAG
jgi:hypothetical protein